MLVVCQYMLQFAEFEQIAQRSKIRKTQRERERETNNVKRDGWKRETERHNPGQRARDKTRNKR